MSLMRALRFFLCVFAAVGSAWTVYSFGIEDAFRDQIKLGLRIAQQTTTQLQNLSLYAQDKGEKDPVFWAVRFLTVGSETRPIQITPVKDSNLVNNFEKFEYQRERGEFIYLKTLIPENNLGVQILINLGYVGFLGTHSHWKNDLSLAGLFVLFFSFFAGLNRLIKTGQIHQSIYPSPTPVKTSSAEGELREFLTIWIMEAKSTLLQLGVHLKYLIRNAQNVAALSVNSRDEGLSRVIGEMNECISRTTEALLNEAKMIQDLKGKTALLKEAQKK